MSSEPGNPRTQPEKIALREIVEAEGVQAGKRFPPSLRNHFEGIKAANNFEEIVGRSPDLNGLPYQVKVVAPTDSTVLIVGETGTGKELIARAIHSCSSRWNSPLVEVNCAALPDGFVDSRLFGHEKGAFTGAMGRRMGRFELANGGSVFLDEIGEMSAEVQVKLLRVLQEHDIERLGGHSPIKVDVRVIAATNRDLQRAVARGTFREDLYYRLNVFPLRVPPLRERMEDIPLLVRYFLQRYTTRIGREIVRVPDDVMCRLTEYSWPGNVRELENVIERAVIVSKGAELRLPAESLTPPAPCVAATDGSATFLKRPLRIYDNAQTEPMTLEQIERNHIIFVLDRTGWRIEGGNGAALILNLKPSTLRSRMKKLGISRTEKGG